MFRKLWWCIVEPKRVRAFYDAGHWKMRELLGTDATLRNAHSAFMRCSKREQEFIVWRDPVFGSLESYVNGIQEPPNGK